MDEDNKTIPESTKAPEALAKAPDVTLGNWLKEQRQKKKVSLEEIAAVTKIHIAQLRNIEEDQMRDLPAPAFVRGFLVSYARHLDLDENEVISRFRKSIGERTSLEDPSILKGNRAARSGSEPKVRVVNTPTFTQNAASNDLEGNKNPFLEPRNILIAAAIVVALILVGFLVALGKRSKKESQKAEVSAPTVVPSLMTPVQSPTNVTLTPSAPAPAPLPAKAATVAPSPKAPVEALGSKKYQMEIRALEQNWVNVRADDGNSQGMLLKSASLTPFQADRRVVLSLSDAGAIEIRWNGIWYASPGFRGDVKLLTLPDELASLSPKAAPKVVARPKPPAAAVVPTPGVDAGATVPPPAVPAPPVETQD